MKTALQKTAKVEVTRPDPVLQEWAQRAEAFGIVGIITEVINPLSGEVHFCELLVNRPPRFLPPCRNGPDDDAI